MNKLLTTLCLSSAILACTPLQAAWQGNWLVGASGGYTHNRGELNVTLINELGRQSVMTSRFKDDGWFLGVLGGYQVRCNGWVLAPEINIDWYDLSDNDNDDDFAYTDSSNRGWNAQSEYKREWVAGLTGRVGYDIATWLTPYVRGGLEWSKDKLSYSQTRFDNTRTIAADGSKNAIRGVVGLGVEVPVPNYNCITVRAEYDFHGKGRIVDASNTVLSNTVDVTREPYYQTAFVSVVWNI